MPGHLPISRIKTIMKSSADANNVSKESVFIMSRAVELFMKKLVLECEQDATKTANGKKMDYKNVANVVNSTERYEFLTEIIPHKITVAQYREMMKKKKGDSTGSDESSESDTER